jgi:hypothetical protein
VRLLGHSRARSRGTREIRVISYDRVVSGTIPLFVMSDNSFSENGFCRGMR